MKKTASFVLAIILLINIPFTASSHADSEPASIDIVFVADISGSVARDDGLQFLKDALRLGVDLAPDSARIAVVTVNTEVVSATDLTQSGTRDGSTQLKDHIDQISVFDDTNYIPGLERALEILLPSTAASKKIIMIGDFIEGGFNVLPQHMEAGAVAAVEALALLAADNGIIIDMVLWAQAPISSTVGSKLRELPELTGGNLFESQSPNSVPSSIEDIYFGSYEYTYTVLSVFGEGAQSMAIPIWANGLRRARVYVSAHSAANTFQIAYAGVDLGGELNGSYSMVDLSYPEPGRIDMTIAPGASGIAKIYTLLDHDPLSLFVSVEHHIEQLDVDGEHDETMQVSEIEAEIVYGASGIPFVAMPHPSDAVYMLELTSPSGKTVTLRALPSQKIPLELFDDFGIYHISATLAVGGIDFGPFSATIEIPDVRPVPEPPEPPSNRALYLSIAVGGILIIIALVIYIWLKRRSKGPVGAFESAFVDGFHGKLSVYAIITDGGNREIPPFEYNLQAADGNKLTLYTILGSIGAAELFESTGAKSISFFPGADASVIVSNDSKATIKAMGRSYGRGTRAQLLYGQKMYVILEEGRNELEINYRQGKDESASSTRVSIDLF